MFYDGPQKPILKNFPFSLTSEREKELTNLLQMMAFAWKLQEDFNGKIRCSFRENDGTLKKPLRIKPYHRGSFILYVSKFGHHKQLCSYEIEFFTDQVSVYNDRIHSADKKGARVFTYNEAIDEVFSDIEDQLTDF